MRIRNLLLVVFALLLLFSSAAVPAYAKSAPRLEWTVCGPCAPSEVAVLGNTITLGVAGRVESDTQASLKHVVSAKLQPATAYSVTFSYDLYTWDS